VVAAGWVASSWMVYQDQAVATSLAMSAGKNYSWHYCDGLRLRWGVRYGQGMDQISEPSVGRVRGPERARAWCSECSQVTPDTNYISRRLRAPKFITFRLVYCGIF
jgi:hypothetical protein